MCFVTAVFYWGLWRYNLVAALNQTCSSRIPVFSVDIIMVSAFEFQCCSLFCVKSLLKLSWFRPFAMAENPPVESWFNGMTCSIPVNPFKLTEKPIYIRAWFVRRPVTKNGHSKSEISMGKLFAWSIRKYWQCKSPIARNQHVTRCSWHDSTEGLAETSWRKDWLLDQREAAGVADQLPTCVVPFRRELRHHTYGPEWKGAMRFQSDNSPDKPHHGNMLGLNDK